MGEIVNMAKKRAEFSERKARFDELTRNPLTFPEIICRLSCSDPNWNQSLRDIALSWDVDPDALREWVFQRARAIMNPRNRALATAILGIEPLTVLSLQEDPI